MPDLISPQLLSFMTAVLWEGESPWNARNKTFGNLKGVLDDLGGCVLFEHPRMYDGANGKARITNLFYAPPPRFYEGYLLPHICMTKGCQERGQFGVIGHEASTLMPKMLCRRCRTKFIGTAKTPDKSWASGGIHIGENHFIWTWRRQSITHPQLHDWAWRSEAVNTPKPEEGGSGRAGASGALKRTSSPTKSPARKKTKG